MKDKNGHLIIHNVSFRTAETLAKALQNAGYSIDADWWSQEEMDNFDSAAMVTINKRPGTFHIARNIQHIQLEAKKPVE